MKLTIISLFTLIIFGCQTDNSNSDDDKLFTNAQIDTSTASGQRFAAAYQVLKDKCMDCHTKRHAHWAAYTEENDWYVNESGQVLVESNNATTSALIYRLKTWGEIGGMPEGPETVTEAEYNILKDWIDNIGS